MGITLLMGLIPRLGQTTAQAQPNVSFQVFYDQLSPYGTWVNYPDYGYVWVPAGGSDFRPYSTRGHWIYADEGWTWVSGYSWGWAPFHYGNWFYDDSYGWMWAPGYEWAPAWVTWGEYQGNYCWAPVGPRVDIGVSFGSYRPAPNYWTFCPRNRITSVNVSNYYVHHVHTTTVINNITVINNVNRGGGGRAYLRGPAPDNVGRYTHTTIHPVAIRPAARPGASNVQHGQLAIYRPAVQNNGNASARPSRVQDLHALRPLPGAHPAPGNNRPGGAPTANHPGGSPSPGNAPGRTPGNQPGRTPQPATTGSGRPVPGNNRPGGSNPANGTQPAQPVNHAGPTHNTPPNHTSPATRPPAINPADKPVTPQGRPAPHQPAANNNRPPVLQHNTPPSHQAPQPRPMPQQPHPASQPQRPAPMPQQQHPAPPPQQRPSPAPQAHPVQPQRPAPRPHPVQPAPHPAPRPAPAPPHPNPPGPEHH